MLSKKNYEDSLRQASEYIRLANDVSSEGVLSKPVCYAASSYHFAEEHASEQVMAALKSAGIRDVMALPEQEQIGKRYLSVFVPHACEEGDVDLLIKIIASGTNIDMPDVDGDTPLMVATAHDNEECVRYLLSVGADPEHMNKAGENSYDIASRFRSTKADRVLQEWKANGRTFKKHLSEMQAKANSGSSQSSSVRDDSSSQASFYSSQSRQREPDIETHELFYAGFVGLFVFILLGGLIATLFNSNTFFTIMILISLFAGPTLGIVCYAQYKKHRL